MSVTTVKASYKGATLSAQYNPEDIDGILRRIDEMAATKGLTRGDARQWIIDETERNGHLPGKPGAETVAHTLLWLACRSDVGTLALQAAKEGGQTLEYEITGKKPAWNFRLIIRPGFEFDTAMQGLEEFEKNGGLPGLPRGRSGAR